MEVLLAISVPEIIQLAYDVLSFTWKQYEAVEERKTQCKVLLEQCQNMLIEIAKQVNQNPDHSLGLANNLCFLER